jgi:hypothetical protein
MAILSDKDWMFFKQNGYVIVPNAVPQENLDAIIAGAFEFLGMDATDREDWYREPLRTNGMAEMYHHQAMWNNRQHPRLHQIFTEIWGTEKLWVSIDRVSFKPPAHPNHPEYDNKGFIHWDANTKNLPLSFGVQGVLYLTDTVANQGGFQCIRGIHHKLTDFGVDHPPDYEYYAPDLKQFKPETIPGKAGDLLIWHRALAHGSSHNTSDNPRLAQYITMSPARPENQEYLQSRIGLWKDREPPASPAFPGDPRQWEKGRPPAELTSLGRKLLGLDAGD